jgi:hypothetical protein
MGILDEAIREHLELKRQHGADDSELKQLEDDAFGPAERPGDEEATPDPFAEAPTEFMAAPEVNGEAAEVAEEATSKREAPDIAALQEAPEPPAEEEQPAMEHEVVPEEPESSGPSTEEREVIADQPTEMFDVEAELRETLDRAPSDEELVEEEISEPRLAPVDPLSGIDEAEDEVAMEASAPEPAAVEEEEEDDFWDEQRLSDELNQALEAPAEETEAVFEEEEEEIVEVAEIEEEPEEEPSPPVRGDQDVLEDTPDFLEDSEDDQLWFEQKPPKDFDFDD